METSLEEEKKINSLKESHHEWDDHHQGKDHLSLSSTSLPDVGIHDPEFHGNGASPHKNPVFDVAFQLVLQLFIYTFVTVGMSPMMSNNVKRSHL